MSVWQGDIPLEKIARIVSLNGNEGGLVLSLSGCSIDDLDLDEPLYIYFDNLPVPFFIGEVKKKSQTRAIVKFVSIDSEDDARELEGRDVWVDYFEDEEDGLPDLEGWKVVNVATGADEGSVAGILDIPGNTCLEMSSGRIFPLAEELIVSLDELSGTIVLSIPEGL